jgi:hypothetical protein
LSGVMTSRNLRQCSRTKGKYKKTAVERMLEYQQAWRMPAPKSFNCDLEACWNFCRYVDRRKMFLFYVLEREMFIVNVRFKIFHHVM